MRGLLLLSLSLTLLAPGPWGELENVEALTHLGVILGSGGHAEEALMAFERALAIDPQAVHALFDKGSASGGWPGLCSWPWGLADCAS